MWRLKGHAVTMRLDVDARTVSFWSTAGMHTTRTDLPAGATEWTAAIGLFNNTATLMAGRWFRPAPASVETIEVA